MTVPIFLELVEAKAKVASIFPFCLGVYFSWYYTHQLNWGLSLMFFCGDAAVQHGGRRSR
nr:hypothetical protein [Secundilactobacillus collinoides]